MDRTSLNPSISANPVQTSEDIKAVNSKKTKLTKVDSIRQVSNAIPIHSKYPEAQGSSSSIGLAAKTSADATSSSANLVNHIGSKKLIPEDPIDDLDELSLEGDVDPAHNLLLSRNHSESGISRLDESRSDSDQEMFYELKKFEPYYGNDETTSLTSPSSPLIEESDDEFYSEDESISKDVIRVLNEQTNRSQNPPPIPQNEPAPLNPGPLPPPVPVSGAPVNLPVALPKLTVADLQNIQNTIAANDNVKIPPEKRLVEIMNDLKSKYSINPDSFEIGTKLDGTTRTDGTFIPKVEPFISGTNTYYKIKCTAIVQFSDQDGTPFKFEFSRDVYTDLTHPTRVADHADVFIKALADRALANILDNYTGKLIQFAAGSPEKPSLEHNSYSIVSKKDTSGRPIAIEKMIATDPVSKQKIEYVLDQSKFVKSNKFKSKFGDEDTQIENSYLNYSNYQLSLSNPTHFAKSSNLKTYFTTVKQSISESKNQLGSFKNDYAVIYKGWKLWDRGVAKESPKLKSILADLSINEKEALESKELPQDISANTRIYLEKKRAYLKHEKQFEKQLEILNALLSKLTANQPLNQPLEESDKNLIANLRNKQTVLSDQFPNDDTQFIEGIIKIRGEKITEQLR